ncbi:hypothetical protein ACETK8_16335 [Brevundimonas staleyi]|uniref:Lipoprotein n=1 Tax=Brevundimonas staleyi TaxID=74326 RepID=A0ABW0FWF3_9CAUL
MRMAVAGAVLIGLTGCASTDDAALTPTDVEVTMNCWVQSDGGLQDCRVTREKPGGYGMAEEALASAREGRASMQPVGGGRRPANTGRQDFTMRMAIDAAAMTRYRRIQTDVSEPRT